MTKEIIEITFEEYLILKKKKISFIAIDIREVVEFSDYNLGDKNIPAHEITDNIEFLKTFENIAVVCSNGTRSHIMARVIQKKIPSAQIYHLTEGIIKG